MKTSKNKTRKKKNKQERELWIEKFKTMLAKYHKRNIDKIANKLFKKSLTIKYSMTSRSKKHNVRCDITFNDLRELILKYYGKPCKYDSGRQVTHKNMVFDHIVPISRGGESTKSNLQIISKFSNKIKGSLDEESLYIFLDWLDSIDPELKKNITIRLAGGKR